MCNSRSTLKRSREIAGLRETAGLISILILAIAAVPGCTVGAHRPFSFGDDSSRSEWSGRIDERQGLIVYVGGAGGDGIFSSIDGVESGLRRAGFRGVIREFRWQSGLGILADQISSVESKRAHGRRLAGEIVTFRRENPGAPVYLVGQSAGTSIAIFALEALPDGERVEQVVLMASSMSAGYDLSSALKHVQGTLTAFCSPADAVLRIFVPDCGTADRVYCGDHVAGLVGFDMASRHAANRPNPRLRNLFWNPSFRRNGHTGGHTDGVNADFVERHVAGWLLGNSPQAARAAQMGGPISS